MEAPNIRLGGLDLPIPYNRNLEAAVVPQIEDLMDAVYQVVGCDD